MKKRETTVSFISLLTSLILLTSTPVFSGERIILHVQDSADLEAVSEEYRLEKVTQKPYHGIAGVRLPDDMRAETALVMLRSDSRIEHAEHDRVYEAVLRPNDPLFRYQWGLHSLQKDRLYSANTQEAWDIEKRERKIIIAILDTGIDLYHPDLKGNIWKNPSEIPDNGFDDDGNGFTDDTHGWDFAYNTDNPNDVYGHGTMVGGVAGASLNNSTGISGIMESVSLMPVKGLTDRGYGYSSDLVQGIYYAVDNGADIINASWGGIHYVKAMKEAIDYASSQGVLFIAAAGNLGRDTDVNPYYPGSYKSQFLISTGASQRNGEPAAFSNRGRASVDLFAPGTDILSTYSKETGLGKYRYASGTSLAAPFVAGAAGLMMCMPGYHPAEEIKRSLINSCTKHEALESISVSGGVINMKEALKELKTAEISQENLNQKQQPEFSKRISMIKKYLSIISRRKDE